MIRTNLFVILAISGLFGQSAKSESAWAPLSFLIGEWTGRAISPRCFACESALPAYLSQDWGGHAFHPLRDCHACKTGRIFYLHRGDCPPHVTLRMPINSIDEVLAALNIIIDDARAKA